MRIYNKKNSAIIQNILGMFPFLLIVAILILHLARPDKTYSKEERRYLAQWPVFHIERLLNGSYETKVESHFSDQFPFRNVWVRIQEGSDQILYRK